MKNADMAAMPVTLTDEQLNEYQHPMVVLNGSRGLTKREYMATAIIQGMFAQYDHLGSEVDAAERAVLVADALLNALEESHQ